MSPVNPTTRICRACTTTRLSGYNPGTVCGPYQREQQAAAGPDGRDNPAAWVRDTVPLRNALALLDFPAALVIYRSATRLSRRELGERTGLPESAIWYYEVAERQGMCDIRQLLQFADSVRMPRPALLPVILGRPDTLDDLLTEPASELSADAGGGSRD